ncbi:MAG: hypothetical protein WKF94_06060 [Solirubrobacteraceae bacterium]
MKFPATLAGVTVALALAAPAGAHERPTVASVQSHTAAATSALDRVEQLVSVNEHASAALALAKSRVQVRAAATDARRLTRKAGKGSAMRAAKANAVLAALNDANVEAFVVLVEEADAGQAAYAAALAASARDRATAIATLTGLAEWLPAAAQSGIASAIAALTADGEAEIGQIVALTASDNVPAAAQPAIDRALGFATEGINRAIGHLNELLGLVPEQARPHVEMALGQVTAALETVRGILSGLFGGSGDSATGGLPIPQGLPIPSFVPIG